MPIRHGGIAATRASIWPRDHFCRRTIAPRWSSPTTWNEFLPISMPMVAMVAIDLLDMAVLRLTLRPISASLAGGAGARPDHFISRHHPSHNVAEVMKSKQGAKRPSLPAARAVAMHGMGRSRPAWGYVISLRSDDTNLVGSRGNGSR